MPYTSANGKKTVRHYLGFATNLRRRIEQHQTGTHGARLMQMINAAGITWTVTHLWLEGGRREERRLKNFHNHADLCPRCNPALRRSITRPGPAQIALPFDMESVRQEAVNAVSVSPHRPEKGDTDGLAVLGIGGGRTPNDAA